MRMQGVILIYLICAMIVHGKLFINRWSFFESLYALLNFCFFSSGKINIYGQTSLSHFHNHYNVDQLDTCNEFALATMMYHTLLQGSFMGQHGPILVTCSSCWYTFKTEKKTQIWHTWQLQYTNFLVCVSSPLVVMNYWWHMTAKCMHGQLTWYNRAAWFKLKSKTDHEPVVPTRHKPDAPPGFATLLLSFTLLSLSTLSMSLSSSLSLF